MGKAAKQGRAYKRGQSLRMAKAYNDAIAKFIAAGERFDPGALAAVVIAAARAYPSSDTKNLASSAVEKMQRTAHQGA